MLSQPDGYKNFNGGGSRQYLPKYYLNLNQEDNLSSKLIEHHNGPESLPRVAPMILRTEI